MYNINFKKLFDDEPYIPGRVMRLIEQTQKNINNNNKQKEKKDKLETIKKIAKKLNLFCDATDRASDNEIGRASCRERV